MKLSSYNTVKRGVNLILYWITYRQLLVLFICLWLRYSHFVSYTLKYGRITRSREKKKKETRKKKELFLCRSEFYWWWGLIWLEIVSKKRNSSIWIIFTCHNVFMYTNRRWMMYVGGIFYLMVDDFFYGYGVLVIELLSNNLSIYVENLL